MNVRRFAASTVAIATVALAAQAVPSRGLSVVARLALRPGEIVTAIAFVPAAAVLTTWDAGRASGIVRINLSDGRIAWTTSLPGKVYAVDTRAEFTLAAAVGNGTRLHVLSNEDGRVVREIHGASQSEYSLSLDGQWIVSAPNTFQRQGRRWSVQHVLNGTERTFETPGTIGAVRAFDGNAAIVLQEDGLVFRQDGQTRVWEARLGKFTSLHRLDLSSDGSTALVDLGLGVLVILDTRTGATLFRYEPSAAGLAAIGALDAAQRAVAAKSRPDRSPGPDALVTLAASFLVGLGPQGDVLFAGQADVPVLLQLDPRTLKTRHLPPRSMVSQYLEAAGMGSPNWNQATGIEATLLEGGHAILLVRHAGGVALLRAQ